VGLCEVALSRTGWAGRCRAALSPWRSPRAAHDWSKVLLDVALAVVLGGGLPGRRGGHPGAADGHLPGSPTIRRRRAQTGRGPRRGDRSARSRRRRGDPPDVVGSELTGPNTSGCLPRRRDESSRLKWLLKHRRSATSTTCVSCAAVDDRCGPAAGSTGRGGRTMADSGPLERWTLPEALVKQAARNPSASAIPESDSSRRRWPSFPSTSTPTSA
jgi:hypothetical protein